jgi:type VI secretion system protein ImpA
VSGASEGSILLAEAVEAAGGRPSGGREPVTLAELLEPIPPSEKSDDPVGESLRYDVLHDRLRELRRTDDPTLPQGVWRHELKKADWKGVERLAGEALRERSKDLRMAAWVVEAWTRLDGLAGLARGVELLTGLIERWGPELHPRFGEDDTEPQDDPALRNAALGTLESSLSLALARLPLTRPGGPGGEDGEGLTWGDWKRALYLENLGAAHPEAAAEAGGITRERFLASVGLTPDGFYPPLALRADACRAGLEALAKLADESYGRDAPAFGAVREELEGIGRLARRLAAERGEEVRAESPEVPAESGGSAPAADRTDPDDPGQGEDTMSVDDPAAGTSAVPARGGEAADEPSGAALPVAITTRAEAYRALDQAAELLLRVEPHSPVPYLVKRAVRWGGLSLSELYGELFQIAEPNVVFRLLGIQRREGEE